ncbi:MAG TPA: LysE family transporter [Chthoniobacterales bacterium]|nr:LysE family transporter [Chthoniobacterales bacterium]
MTFQLFIKGLVLGFAIAAPVGPIGVLCIRRSLADGQRAGLATGLGAATADAIYGCIAGFGLAAVSRFLLQQRFWLGLLGGLFLCYLGVRAFFTKPVENPRGARKSGLLGAYFSTFFLTITNPMTILSFVAVFAGLGLVTSSSYREAAALVAGVFIGSASWWVFLSTGAALLRKRVGPKWLQFVNHASGLVIFALGVYALIGLIKS